MAINKKLIHFNRKEVFEEKLANNEILDTSIVFVKDSKEIYTHGNLYKSVNWSVLEKEMITFTVNGVLYSAENGMTWKDWIYSDYNPDNFWIVDDARIMYLHEGSTNSLWKDGDYIKPEDKIISNAAY